MVMVGELRHFFLARFAVGPVLDATDRCRNFLRGRRGLIRWRKLVRFG